MLRQALVGLLVFCNAGCGIVGPSCVDRRQTGIVAAISGQVAAGQIVSHRVPYGTEGSQNDARFSWTGDSGSDARLRLYATGVGCASFSLPLETNTGACAVLASAGSLPNGAVASTLIITHGRGNPERLGNPPEYILWVVGDAERSASYTINITWLYGPDC
jgi:hypothetical protein